MSVNSLPKTVTRQRRDCDLNPGPSAPESSTLTTRLPSHPSRDYHGANIDGFTARKGIETRPAEADANLMASTDEEIDTANRKNGAV